MFRRLASLAPRASGAGLVARYGLRSRHLVVGGCVVGGVSGAALVNSSAMCDGAGAAVAAGPSLLQKCVAEAIGTGMIVSGGCGVVCALKYAGHPITPLGIGAAFGLSVTLAIYATAGISGAHLNPAVTISLVTQGAMDAAEAGPYIAAQIVGAAVAAVLNLAMFSAGVAAMEAKEGIKRGAKGAILLIFDCFPTILRRCCHCFPADFGLCAGSCASFAGAFGMVPNGAICSNPRALFVETVITGFLVFSIYAFTDPNNKVADGAAPVLIGTTVAALVHVFAPVTGAGMNPARDLGPRLVTLATGWGGAALSSGWWIYTLGPITGGVLGGFAYKYTLGAAHEANKED